MDRSQKIWTGIIIVICIVCAWYWFFEKDHSGSYYDQEGYEEYQQEQLEEMQNEQKEAELLHLQDMAVIYEDAKDYLYTDYMVEGPVADITYATDSSGSPTFIDLGEAYPSEDRFTIVIWEEHLSDVQSVLNDIEINDLIFVEGYIDMYDGIPQIEVTDPEQITVWK